MTRAKELITAVLLAAFVSTATAQTPPVPHKPTGDEKLDRIRKNWTPGGTEMIPVDVLTMFPCHDESLPCGKMAPPPVERVTFKGPLTGDPKKGETIAINVRYGNCIACHHLPGHQGGTIGPSLAEYSKRGMPVDYTYQRIWDVRAYNPYAFMPVYGPNRVLTDQEIRDVMVFIGAGN